MTIVGVSPPGSRASGRNTFEMISGLRTYVCGTTFAYYIFFRYRRKMGIRHTTSHKDPGVVADPRSKPAMVKD